jgi:hypothetical protein
MFVREGADVEMGRVASPKVVSGHTEDEMPKKGGKKKKKR